MTAEAALAWLVFGPLLCACALLVVGDAPRAGRVRAAIVLAALVAPPALLLAPSLALRDQAVVEFALAGWVPPLGIGMRLDALSLLMLWLVAVVGAGAGAHAFAAQPPQAAAGARYWPVWLLMVSGLNAFFLSADLFNLYVAIELVTLAGVALVAWSGTAAALRAAMRYLLLAMLGSLAYLLAVALLYGEHGTLDLYLLADHIAEGSAATRTALALALAALLLKGAIFPLHVWLPPAHARAPGAVSAVLSALVVKAALYLLYRLWFWTLADAQPAPVAVLLGALGAAAVLFGSVAALVQLRLKRMVAYSTVAQLGYLMLLFPLAAAAGAGAIAWHGTVYQLLAHALAKSAMFLAAANLLQGLGSDRLDDLAGAGRRMPLSVFAFAVAGVSLMGLPPSGGFLAKWLLLEAAWTGGGWAWMAVLLVGSLLAAVYVFRALGAMFAAPPEAPGISATPLPRTMEFAALALAALAIAAGFFSAPVFGLLDAGPPFPVTDPDLPVVDGVGP